MSSLTKIKDLTGLEFGKLTVVSLTEERQGGSPIWLCNCSCGVKDVKVSTRKLNSGHTKSCGCLKSEKLTLSNTKHGQSRSRIYNIYIGMKSRCENKLDKNYDQYGGRGIIVCDEWVDFNNFHKWSVLNGYTDEMSLDRINNNGNYDPSNCRWVSMKLQANNRSNNILLNICGETLTLTECCEKYGLSYYKYQKRRWKGHNIEQEINDLFITEIKK